MTDVELLRAAIKASGLSARKFATQVLIRDERTIRRWVKGDTTFGPAVRAKLEELLGINCVQVDQIPPFEVTDPQAFVDAAKPLKEPASD